MVITRANICPGLLGAKLKNLSGQIKVEFILSWYKTCLLIKAISLVSYLVCVRGDKSCCRNLLPLFPGCVASPDLADTRGEFHDETINFLPPLHPQRSLSLIDISANTSLLCG